MSHYIAKFSGHDTFPLRYGWLYKFAISSQLENWNSQTTDTLMSEWGVGKNMVNAIKYWANRVGVVDDEQKLSAEYEIINSMDPYIEKKDTVWLMHWLLNRNYKLLSASSIFFNYYNGQKVDKESLSHFISDLFDSSTFDNSKYKKTNQKLPAVNTLDKDIGVTFLTYSKNQKGKVSEDSFSSPLTELGLINSFEKNTYLCEFDERRSLSDEMFLFCLLDYFETLNIETDVSVSTMAFDAFLSSAGSPARIFRMSQTELENRLDRIGKLTNECIGWTDTSGLRQIQIKDSSILNNKLSILRKLFK